MSVQNPHDHFFRESFSKPEIIVDFLQEYMPAEIAAELDLDTLDLQSDSFIDDDLREHRSDMLYQVMLNSGKPLFIYLLFEHKSYIDRLVALQVLRYMVRIWEKFRPKKQTDHLTPILPLVIYHGAKKWEVATDFHSLFGEIPASLKPQLPQFNYQLHDFSHLSDVQLRGQIWLRVCLLAMRTMFDPNLRDEFRGLISLAMRLLDQKTGLDYLRLVLYYFTGATERISKDDLREALEEQAAQGEKVMATIAEEYRAEGREQLKLEAAIRMLPILSDEAIGNILNMPIEEVRKLRIEYGKSAE